MAGRARADLRRIASSFPAEQAADGAYAPTITPVIGGRTGHHDPAFTRLWEEMTMVYRQEPGAEW
ncbi:MAG: hypothetical protein U0841_13340 [Chloroflexia bacterium]